MSDYIKEAQALIKERGLTKESNFFDWWYGVKKPREGGSARQFGTPMMEGMWRRGVAKEVYGPPSAEELKAARDKYLQSQDQNKSSTYVNMRKLDPKTYGEPPKYIKNPFSE